MVRNKIDQLRNSVRTFFSADNIGYTAMPGMFVIIVGGFISLAPVDGVFKFVLFIVVVIAAVFITASIYHYSIRTEENGGVGARENTIDSDNAQHYTPVIPPMPSTPPKVKNIDVDIPPSTGDDPQFAVLKKISNRLEADALEKEQARENERKTAEAKAKLLADDTVYYDETPGPIYYVRRGLWRTLVAVIATALIVWLSIASVPPSQGYQGVAVSLFAILILLWYAIRRYGEWRWTRRQLIGNLAVVKQASNGWFALYGKEYSISLLDCGNAVVAKTWYERALRLSTATVSIETPFENKKPGDPQDKVTDVFKDMRNMRDPMSFRKIVLKRHDELTFGQPDVIRRSQP
jgi:hypothetical protein